MKTSENNTPSNMDSNKPIPTPNPVPVPVPTPAPAEDNDFGYDDPAPTPKPDDKPAPKPDDKPVPTPEKVEKPSTGYGVEDNEETPPAPEPEKKVVDPKDMTDEQKAIKELEDIAKTLEGYDTKKIVDFAHAQKFTKEQLKAYVDMTKAEDAAALEAQKTATKNLRAGWEKSLREDKDFGNNDKDTFIANVTKAEKVLEKFFPNIKKELTDKKGMLPPSFMKDLLGVHKVLNPTTEFDGGDPLTPTEDEGNFIDQMYE